MTEPQAERTATLLLGVAAAGATYYILRTPLLRRAAWQLARTAVAAAGPWLMAEVRTAWEETGARRQQSATAALRGATGDMIGG